MNKMVLRFSFDFGDICLWGMNDSAKKQFGYAIESSSLPFSRQLMDKLNGLQEEFGTILDWEDPASGCIWTEQHKLDFLERANEVCREIQQELGSEFEIINEASQGIL